jgi:hypothetical protein
MQGGGRGKTRILAYCRPPLRGWTDAADREREAGPCGDTVRRVAHSHDAGAVPAPGVWSIRVRDPRQARVVPGLAFRGSRR